MLDTKAAVHERYAGGPRDTAFSCIVDVQIAWREAVAVQISPDTKADVTGYLLEPSERTEQSGQQSTTTLANNLSPPLRQVFGSDFGRDVAPAPNMATQQAADTLRETRLQRQQEVLSNDAKMARLALNKQGQGAGDATVQEVAAKMTSAATEVRRVLGASPNAALIDELVGTTQFGLNPMDTVRKLLQVDGVTYAEPDPEADSSNLWDSFYEYRQKCSEAMTSSTQEKEYEKYYSLIGNAKKKWQDKASNEIGTLMNKATPKLAGLFFPNEEQQAARAAIKAKIAKYVAAMKEAKEATEAVMGKGDDAMDAAMSTQLSNILNRANIFLVLFHQIMSRIGDRTGQETFVLKTCSKDIAQALEESALLDETLHLSALCDLYEKHFPVDATYSRLTALARQQAAAAAAPAPAPAPVAPVAAVPAARTGASAGGKAPAKGRKSPARPRPGTAVATGASAAAAPPAPVAPAASPAPTGVPAAAAGMSSTPLVPTQVTAAESAAPRRRAREAAGSESVTNSLFENMFKPTATEGSAEEQPASPTPSSGSEGPSGGPRTFRRQR